MKFLVLNRRRILDRLHHWFPPGELVVLTASSALGGADPGGFHHLEVVEDYDSPATDTRIERLAEKFAVDAVLLTAEIDVLRAARLRERLGLPGQGIESAVAYRNKYVMKTGAAAAGIPVAAMRPVTRPEEVAEFAAEHGYPVVVKRFDGAAAMGMHVYRSEAGLPPDGWPAPMLAEQWIEGDLCHVDGVMRAGEVLLSWPSRYLHSQWASASESANELGGMLSRQDPLFEPLRKATARVIAALPPAPDALPFHAEFFATPDGELVLCEIACRAGGGEIVEMFERAFGVNLYEAGLKGQAGRYDEISWRAEPRRHGWGWMPRRAGVLLEIPAKPASEAVCSYSVSGIPGTEYAAPRGMADVIARMVFTMDGADVRPELHALDEWWSRTTRWDR
ncbi:acetyl-CoA carboxylase biotin carboxylase subunit family protein [Amycolatopsis sp. cmx-4-61]|uniref:ATP-grasp domain-containing protein n=1 Tax=Amycolatopsis sp. cmx-4-61 TaxID=2790937 RepID=UPI00397AC4BE